MRGGLLFWNCKWSGFWGMIYAYILLRLATHCAVGFHHFYWLSKLYFNVCEDRLDAR